MIVMAGSFFTELQEDEGAIHECLGQFVDIHLFPFRDKSWPVSCRIDSEDQVIGKLPINRARKNGLFDVMFRLLHSFCRFSRPCRNPEERERKAGEY